VSNVRRMGRPGCPDCRGLGYVRTTDCSGDVERAGCACSMTSTERATYQRSLEAILARSLGVQS
jgi:hypothetical protein